MVHGLMTATVGSSGKDVSIPFAARLLIDPDSLGKTGPKLLSYQGWAVCGLTRSGSSTLANVLQDTSPLAAALRGE